ncbi:MAG: epoxide hydrolase N-terminal domain-containing protein, partial [Pseudomonadales bacterium]
MSRIEPFRINVDDGELTDLKARLARTRFPEAETPDDWSQGLP